MDIIQLRRRLHQQAEVGFCEYGTASFVVETLQTLGYQVCYGEDAIDTKHVMGLPESSVMEAAYNRALLHGANPDIITCMRGGKTAVIAELAGSGPGPTIAFRFDMDALPIMESRDGDHLPQASGFRSSNDGSMHACGHDGHTSIGLGLAERMAGRSFAGKLKLIFQPAEEGARGAYAMMKRGVVEDVDKIICLHLGLGCPSGEMSGGTNGWFSSRKYQVAFHGVPSHAAAAPESGRNALLGAATALLNIHAISRYAAGDTRINVGMLEGGTAINIVPDYARMSVEVRAATDEILADLEKRLKDIIAGSALMHGLTYEMDALGMSRTIACNDRLVQIALDEAREMGVFQACHATYQVKAGEDASWFIHRVQELGGEGTYMLIGSDLPAPHHHYKFDIDETVLANSVSLLERMANRLLQAADEEGVNSYAFH